MRFLFGLVGVVAIGIIPEHLSCLQNVERSTAVLGKVDARALSLTGCIIGLDEMIGHDRYMSSGVCSLRLS